MIKIIVYCESRREIEFYSGILEDDTEPLIVFSVPIGWDIKCWFAENPDKRFQIGADGIGYELSTSDLIIKQLENEKLQSTVY